MSSLYFTEVEEEKEKGRIGTAAPDFTLYNQRNELWTLSKQRGEVTVLLFYPGNETLVCTRQLCSLKDHWIDYKRTNATIVGISPGTPEGHAEFAAKRKLPIDLLADPDRVVTSLFAKHWLFPVSVTRGIVVIDSNGFIRSREIMLRAVRPSDESIIADIYAARHDALSSTYGSLRKRLMRMVDRRI